MGLKENIKKERLKNDLTLENVAKYLGVSKQTVQKYESGVVANIPSDKIEAMAKLFHTTPAALMGWENKSDNTIKEKKEAARQYMQDELHRIGVLPKTEEITPERFESFLRSYEYFLKIFKESTGEDS